MTWGTKCYFFYGDEYMEKNEANLIEGNSVEFAWIKTGNWSDLIKELYMTNIEKNNQVNAGFIKSNGDLFLFSDDEYVRYSGNNHNAIDSGYPKSIQSNSESLGNSGWTQVDGAMRFDNKNYFFNMATNTYVVTGARNNQKDIAANWGVVRNNITEGHVDSAYVEDGKLFLTSGDEYVRYTLSGNTVPDLVDSGYPKTFEMPSLDSVWAAVAIDHGESYFTYIISSDSFIRYERTSDGIFENAAHVEGYIPELLEDMGFSLTGDNAEFATYNKLSAYGAAYHNGILYLCTAGISLQCDMDSKTITKVNFGSNFFHTAYVNSSNVLRKTTSSQWGATLDVVDENGNDYFYVFTGSKYNVYNSIPSNFNNISWSNSSAQTISSTFGISKIDAAYHKDNQTYLFSSAGYFVLANGKELSDDLDDMEYIFGNWGNVPYDLTSGMDAALYNSDENILYFFKEGQYIAYDTSDANGVVPYLMDEVDYKLIRLTTSTAYKLNEALFMEDGVENLLKLETQSIDELPSFSWDSSSASQIRVTDQISAIAISS
ncbi:MAG: hypothetical protein AAF570_20030, partial [Bacteroidota bacterium]